MDRSTADPRWIRPQDERLFDALVDDVRADRCYAFVGAGPSKPAGYPDWKGLMCKLAKEAGITEFASEDYLDRAEECCKAMGEDRYYAFLERTFSELGKEPFRPIHQYIVRTPFKACLTTNFDNCLEKAAETLGVERSVHIHPDLNPLDLKPDHIFHIHGKLHYEPGKRAASSILLRRSDYVWAYEQTGSIATLLRPAYSYGAVLFIGCSLSDPLINRFLIGANEQYNAMNLGVQQRGLGQTMQNRHYALLPIKGGFLGHGRQRSFQRDEEGERRDEEVLGRTGIAVLRYPADDSKNHHNLTGVIESIMKRTQRSPTVPSVVKRDLILPSGVSAA